MRHTAVILVFILLTGLQPSGSSAAGRVTATALTEGVPAEAIGVFVLDYAGLRRSGLYSRLEQSSLPSDQVLGYDRFVEATGLSPREDIDASLCVLLGATSRPGFACLAGGRFSSQRVGETLELVPHARLDQESAIPLWEFGTRVTGTEDTTDADQRAAIGSLALPREGLAVFGDTASVRKVLAVLDGREPRAGRGSTALLPDGSGQLQARLDMDVAREYLVPREAQPQMPMLLSKVSQLQLDVEFGRTLEFRALVRAEDPEQADLMRQALLGAIAAAKLKTDGDFPVQALLAEIQVLRAGSEIEIAGSLSEDLLMRLLERAHSEHGWGEHDQQ
jgi:hypothetical protein